MPCYLCIIMNVSLRKREHPTEQPEISASYLAIVVSMLLTCALPIMGLLIGNRDITPFLEFPPRTRYVEQAPFSWGWWLFYATVGFGLVGIVTQMVKVSIRLPRRPGARTFLALIVLGISWAIAWQRWSWAQAVQGHTFLLLWGSYILLANALLYEIHGSAPLIRSSFRYLLSFPLSGLFWWMFEFLNRFTQNWFYQNVEHFSPLSYLTFATLSFSTILPSVWVTHELLQKTIVISKPTQLWLGLNKTEALILVLGSGCVLVVLPLLPNFLFAAIWGAPLFLILGFESLKSPSMKCVTSMAIWSLATLWCGFLWELWNVYSSARWEYAVPFVDRFHIFQMPLVGYAGYLPFGALCGVLVCTLRGERN